MAAPAYATHTTTTQSANATSITGGKPSGVAEGDLLIASLQTMGSNPIHLTPSGWFVVAGCQNIRDDISTPRVSQFWKIAGASEPSTYTFEFSALVSNRQTLAIVRFTGVNQIAPINASNAATGADDTPVCPSVNTTVNECLIWRSCTIRPSGQTITGVPSGHTERYNFAVGGPAGHRNGMATAEQTTAGATGTGSFATSTATNWCSATIAIAPPEPASSGARFCLHGL